MIDHQTRAQSYRLEVGTPDLRSTGPIAFGPDGILFVADNINATIFALDAVDATAPVQEVPSVENLDVKLAAYLGCPVEDVHVRDLAAHPLTGAVYLSVMRGAGEDALPVLIHVAPDGSLEAVSLEKVPFSSITITDAPSAEDERTDGRVVPVGEPAEEERVIGDVTLRNTGALHITLQEIGPEGFYDGPAG